MAYRHRVHIEFEWDEGNDSHPDYDNESANEQINWDNAFSYMFADEDAAAEFMQHARPALDALYGTYYSELDG